MKPRLTHPLTQVVLTSILSIVVTIACTAYKSAGSRTIQTNTATPSESQAQTINSSAQVKTPCMLALAGAPDINGLKLGMTANEVLAQFPGSKEDEEVRNSLSRPLSQFGVSDLLIRPAKYESKEKFVGINQITFTFLDGHVSNFTVGYNGPDYSHVDKFVTKFVEGRSLPPVEQWQAYVGMDNQLKILTCKEFEVRVFAGGTGGNLNYLLVKDLVADAKLKDRRKRAREKATPTPISEP